MPSSSMRLSRACGSHDARSASASVSGCDGGGSSHPPTAAAATPMTLRLATYQAGSPLSSAATWGTRSPQRCVDTRDVHRSGGSTTWVSVSMILTSSRSAGLIWCLLSRTDVSWWWLRADGGEQSFLVVAWVVESEHVGLRAAEVAVRGVLPGEPDSAVDLNRLLCGLRERRPADECGHRG